MWKTSISAVWETSISAAWKEFAIAGHTRPSKLLSSMAVWISSQTAYETGFIARPITLRATPGTERTWQL